MMRIFGERGTLRQATPRRERPSPTRRLRFEQVESRVMLSAWEGEAPAEPLGQVPEVWFQAPVLEDRVAVLGSPGTIATGAPGTRLTIYTGGAIQVYPAFGDDFVYIAESLIAIH